MIKVIREKSEWKPVSLQNGVFDHVECLIGVEELKEYEVETKKRPLVKRKLEDKSTASDDPKKNKKKKKKQQKKTKPNEFAVTEVRQEVEDTEYYCWDNLGVPREVARALLENGFKKPTEIQTLSIPPAIFGRRDLLGAAETGSGKTLAFGIPIVYGIMRNLEEVERSEGADDKGNQNGEDEEADSKEDEEQGTGTTGNRNEEQGTGTTGNRLWALILTPTRELAIQIKEHLDSATKYTQVKVAVVIGGMSSEKQSRLLNKRPHILVATPGRLWELLNLREPHLQDIHNIRFLAIDETDRMLEKDHYPELRSLLERINSDAEASALRQNFVFSATLTFVHEPPKYLANKHKKIKRITPGQKLENVMKVLGITNHKVVDITTKTGTAGKLTERKITCRATDKDVHLFAFLARHGGHTLVFCNSIGCVRRCGSILSLLGVKPISLHSGMQQRQRMNNLERFKDDPRGVLLATDVAARGLDIKGVDHVIHYQTPRTSEGYVHRSGRTARADNEGLTVLFIEPSELKSYAKLCSNLGRDGDLPDFPVETSLLNWAKERVNLAREIDLMELSSRKINSSIGWMEKTAEMMDIVLDEDQIPDRPEATSEDRHRRECKLKRKRLERMLQESPPVVAEGASSLAVHAGHHPTARR